MADMRVSCPGCGEKIKVNLTTESDRDAMTVTVIVDHEGLSRDLAEHLKQACLTDPARRNGML